MKILFVWPNPPGFCFEYYPDKNKIPELIAKFKPMVKPLTFISLANVTPDEYQVELVEGLPSDINYDIQCDIAAITSTTRYSSWTYDIADKFRQKGVYVVIRGWHASALPDETKNHADTVVIGEAEEIWPKFLRDFKDGKTKPFYYPRGPVDISSISYKKDKLYDKNKEITIMATRGCPSGCNFCSITNMICRNMFRKRPIDDVINDIKNRRDKFFNFEDNSLTNDPRYSKELFKAMKGLNKKFFAFANINTLGRDEEFLKLASEAGCVGFSVGFESISQKSIEFVNKPTNTVEKYASAIKKIHDNGITVIESFVFGADFDTLQVFDDTDEFVNKYEIDIPDPYVLTPYPGSPLFDKLDKEGRILTRDWSKYNLERVVFQPKNMTPEELEVNTKLLHDKWLKFPSIFRRMLKSAKNGRIPMSVTLQQHLSMKYFGRFNYS